MSIPGLSVTQESHSNGHVDISVDAYFCLPARTKLREAKVYDGPKRHLEGLNQLLGRYTTGREGRGLLIEYFKKRNIKGLIEKLREVMDTHLPLKQKGACQDHKLKWSFITTHGHDSGEDLHVGHIGCNIHLGEPDDE